MHGNEMPEEEADLWRVASGMAAETPKQSNSTDCGILQMTIMDYLCDELQWILMIQTAQGSV